MKRTSSAFMSIVVLVATMAIFVSPAAAKTHYSTVKSTPSSDAAALRTHPVRSAPADTPVVTTVEVSDSSGFDWGAASIGAATVLGLGVLMSGAVLVNRRRHRPITHRTAAG